MRRPATRSGSSIRLRDHPFQHRAASGGVNRGCAYWSDGKTGRRAPHHSRHFGRPLVFARREDRQARPGISAQEESAIFGTGSTRTVAALDYGPTSAPAVWNDTIIVGVSCGEGPGIAAPGDIRAFDVRTGKEVWRFRTVPGTGRIRKRDVGRRFLERSRRRRTPGVA